MIDPHTHDWKYNEAKEVFLNDRLPYWEVYRFCTSCLVGETVEIKNIEQQR